MPADERIAIMWRICSVGASAIAMPHEEAVIASRVVVIVRLLRGRRDGDGSLPSVAKVAAVAVKGLNDIAGLGQVGGARHGAMVAAVPTIPRCPEKPEPS